MLFMLLSSFFILSGAIKTTSLQPLVKMEVHNASAPDLMSVLASKGNPDVLLKILENADPTKVGAIILLIQDLLADTELDLETLTTAVTDANSVYDSAESAHSASVEAQTVGVAKLAQDVVDVVLAQTKGVAKLAQDVSDSEQAKVDGEAALALDVASALGKKQTALGVKIEAQRALDAEESRLVSEIERLKQLIVDIKSLATGPSFIKPDFRGTYDSCVAHCLTVDGGGYRIASVHSDAENDLLYKLVTEATYIGAEETSVNGVWAWNDGTPWDYTPSMNDGLKSSAETRICAYTDGKWHDWGQGGQIRPVICRRV